MRPFRSSASSTMRVDVLLGRDVGLDPALRRVEVCDHDLRALALEPLDDRGADPLRAAGHDRDLAVERTHQRNGENAVGIRIRFCWVCRSGWSLARKSFHASSAWSSVRLRSRSA